MDLYIQKGRIMRISKHRCNNLWKYTLENEHLQVDVVPALGGKLTSIFNRRLGKEFLWNNKQLPLKKQFPNDDYDTNFWGGVDELLPNDIVESIDGVDYPDHGELWTTGLECTVSENLFTVSGELPKSKLFYSKQIELLPNSPRIRMKYKIQNRSGQLRHFLWKLHAALNISEGDRLESKASKGKIVYPESSRFTQEGAFEWPMINGMDASRVPAKDNTMDFFYLWDSPEGEMTMVMDNGKICFTYEYDQGVFPYQWYFASYGKFRNHYTAILEPASAMPVSVNQAQTLNQCTKLLPDETLTTVVTIYAGAYHKTNRQNK